MKAAVVEGPNRLVVKEVPEPIMGDYEALCEVLYCATCTGTDSHIVECNFPFSSPIPTLLGHEAIGRVLSVGSKVRNYKPGDLISRVGCPAVEGYSSTWGGFAEKALALDHRAMTADGLPVPAPWLWLSNEVLPDEFDPAAATMIITWRETWSYITRMGVKEGSSVLILGSGGNGLSFSNHARNLGAARIIMAGSPERKVEAQKTGVIDYFDYRSTSCNEELLKACGSGVDYVIDAVGKAGMLELGVRCLKAGGTVGMYGLDDFGKVSLNPLCCRGSFTFYNGGYSESEAHEAIVSFMKQGKLDASIWLDLKNPFPLAKINEAFTTIRERKAVKALVKIK